jgi:hypothetical protein
MLAQRGMRSGNYARSLCAVFNILAKITKM